MSTILLTGPVGDGDESAGGPDGAERDDQSDHAAAAQANDRSQARGQSTGRRQKPPTVRKEFVPSRKSILATVSNLPKLVATGAITPAQSNSMHAALRTLLDELREDDLQAGSHGANTPKLRNALLENPDLLDAIAPLLSDAELQQLADDDDGDDSQTV